MNCRRGAPELVRHRRHAPRRDGLCEPQRVRVKGGPRGQVRLYGGLGPPRLHEQALRLVQVARFHGRGRLGRHDSLLD